MAGASMGSAGANRVAETSLNTNNPFASGGGGLPPRTGRLLEVPFSFWGKASRRRLMGDKASRLWGSAWPHSKGQLTCCPPLSARPLLACCTCNGHHRPVCRQVLGGACVAAYGMVWLNRRIYHTTPASLTPDFQASCCAWSIVRTTCDARAHSRARVSGVCCARDVIRGAMVHRLEGRGILS